MTNIYGPNEDDPNFYLTVSNELNNIQTDHTIIRGDFNFLIDPIKDCFNYAREYNTNAKNVFSTSQTILHW